jgi:hypothetical protein
MGFANQYGLPDLGDIGKVALACWLGRDPRSDWVEWRATPGKADFPATWVQLQVGFTPRCGLRAAYQSAHVPVTAADFSGEKSTMEIQLFPFLLH